MSGEQQLKATLKRAAEMLKIASAYITSNDPEGRIFYDEAQCDGYCVATDCIIVAGELEDFYHV